MDTPGSSSENLELNFDPELSPLSEHNKKTAKHFGLRFDCESQCYRDNDGSIVRDRFGQPI